MTVKQAAKLKTARTIALTGDATATATFDGTANASLAVTIAKATDTTYGTVKGGTDTTITNGDITVTQAAKLKTARTIALTGDATATATFDGSVNASLAVTLGNSAKVNGIYARNNAGAIEFSIDNINWQAMGGGSVIKSIQRGVATPVNNAETMIIPISGIDPLKTNVTFNGVWGYTTADGAPIPYLQAITNNSITVGASGHITTSLTERPFSWQVIEYN